VYLGITPKDLAYIDLSAYQTSKKIFIGKYRDGHHDTFNSSSWASHLPAGLHIFQLVLHAINWVSYKHRFHTTRFATGADE
jgi:hypothetical protein